MLIVFSGLPGVGKTALSRAVAVELSAAHIRVDAVVSALLRAQVGHDAHALAPAAYLVADAVADGCLATGGAVVVDGVNPTEAHRERWRVLAQRRSVPLLFVEVVCSDVAVHRERVVEREPDFMDLPILGWEQARASGYEPWADPPLVVDNIGPLQRHVKRVALAAGGLVRG